MEIESQFLDNLGTYMFLQMNNIILKYNLVAVPVILKLLTQFEPLTWALSYLPTSILQIPIMKTEFPKFRANLNGVE